MFRFLAPLEVRTSEATFYKGFERGCSQANRRYEVFEVVVLFQKTLKAVEFGEPVEKTDTSDYK